MPEKRKYPRFDVAAKIKFKKAESADGQQEAFVKNVSAEGFCFYSQEAVKPGEVLEIEIVEEKIQEAPIRIKGQVVWSYINSQANGNQNKDLYLTGVQVIGIRRTDEARFAMLYCERMLAELKSFLHL
jgi:hypothetical protein